MLRPRSRLAVVAAVVAVILGVAVVLMKGGSRGGAGRVMILALDGMDPQTVDLLMSEGKLPNFAKLRQEGAYGRLRSSPPLLSPVIWTTVATGKTPDQHGIGHFIAVSPTGENLPVTSRMRKVKAHLEHPLRQGEEGRRGGLVGDVARGDGEGRDRERPHLLPLPVPAGARPRRGSEGRHLPARAVREDPAAGAPPHRRDRAGSGRRSSTSRPRSSRGPSPSTTTSATSSGRSPPPTPIAASASSSGRTRSPTCS